MGLLWLLALIGVLAGLAGGASLGGDWQILGAGSGLVMAVTAWLIATSARRALYERKLNRHFQQEFHLQDRADRPQ